MLYYSIWMALVVVAGVVLMLHIIKKVGEVLQNSLSSSRKLLVRQKVLWKK